MKFLTKWLKLFEFEVDANSKKRRKIKFFLNLEKRGGIQDQIRKLIGNGKNISAEKRIRAEIELCYQTLFKKMRRNLLLSTQHL